MLLLEGLGTIVFGLWIMSHGTGHGESIMFVFGLPVALFGIVLTIIGFTKSLKEKTPVVPALGLEQSPKKRDRFPTVKEGVLLGSRKCVYDLSRRWMSSSPKEMRALNVAQSTA